MRISQKEMGKMEQYEIRLIQKEELPILEDLLYEAIFQSSADKLAREIIFEPELFQYIEDFGREEDHCVVAVIEGEIVGAAWVRVLAGEIRGYGNIDNQTPELAISLLPHYRKKGIGRALMAELIKLLRTKGYQQISLSVDKANDAVKFYESLGFQLLDQRDEDYIFVLKLLENTNI